MTTAAQGGLQPVSADRLRGACPHLVRTLPGAQSPAYRIWVETTTGLDGLVLATIQNTLGELVRCEPYYAPGDAVDDWVAVTGLSLGDGPGSMLASGFRTWDQIVQHRALRHGRDVLVTLFHIDPDDERRPARVRITFPKLPDGQYRARNLLSGHSLLAEPMPAARLRQGFDVLLQPKDVLLVELKAQ